MGRWDSPPRGGDISPLRRPAAADRERERDARAAPLPEHSPRVQQGGAGASAVAERPKQPEQRAAANKDDNAAPSFGLSGALAAEANAVAPGASATFAPPLEAAVPGQPWRLYVFKRGELVGEPLRVHREPCYVFGRDARLADIRTDHPSCSKEHAALVFRRTTKLNKETQLEENAVRPYIIDLGSANGTKLNGETLPSQRYVELLHKDTLQLAHSSREYTLLNADMR